MKIYIPGWHYRARAIVQRSWGWSPVEEMILLALDRTPGTIEDVEALLKIPNQVIGSTVARLMQFGLVEIHLSPRPVLATSRIGRDFVRSGRALPERKAEREVGISIVYEKVGHSLFRNRDVSTIPAGRPPSSDRVVAFPSGEPPETDDSMMQRVDQFMAGTLRPGERLRGVQAISSVIERKYLVIELDDVKDGVLPEGASNALIRALQTTIRTGILPEASVPPPDDPPSIDTTFDPSQLIVGAEQHLETFERIVGSAKSDIFVLSTFVASQSDQRGKERRERVWRALEDACKRGVHCHLFYGTSLDNQRDNAVAMQELSVRLSSVRLSRGYVLVQRDSVGSHAKFLAADDGQGGAVALLGSCNWLSSPFSAVEVSVEFRERQATAACLDLLRSTVATLSSASRSVETLQFMSSELRHSRSALSTGVGTAEPPAAQLTIIHAADHERLLRRAAHEAGERFVCCTNRVGATMVPALFNPAEVAGRRLDDVRVYYSRYSGPIKRRHVATQRERLNGVVDLIGAREPQLHAKFLAWDTDHVVVSSINWGSQSGSPENPLDEIGLYLKGPNLATRLLERFEAEFSDRATEG